MELHAQDKSVLAALDAFDDTVRRLGGYLKSRRDFLDGLMLVIEKGEHMNIYHVGTMDESSIANVAALIGRCFGKDIVIVPGERLQGSTPRRCPDISKIKRFGFSQKVSLLEGLRKTVKWYVENAHKKPEKLDGAGLIAKKG